MTYYWLVWYACGVLSRAEFESARADLSVPKDLPQGWSWEPWHEVWPYDRTMPLYESYIWTENKVSVSVRVEYDDLDHYREPLERQIFSSAQLVLAQMCLSEKVRQMA